MIINFPRSKGFLRPILGSCALVTLAALGYSAIVATVFVWRALTRTTPVIVKQRPKAIISVKGSLNRSHAINAVVGGVKYNKLVTFVAAPFRIIMNNKLIEPIDSGKIAQSKAPITDAFQTMTPVSKKYMQKKHSTAETPYWIEDPARKSNTGQYFFWYSVPKVIESSAIKANT